MTTRSSQAILYDLRHKYQNAAWPGVGDANGLLGSTVAGSLYLALLDDSEVEISYVGYARQPIARSAVGFPDNGVSEVTNGSQLTYVIVPAGTTPVSATKCAI